MKLIETKTLTVAAASIEFTSIPQTFTDLVVVWSLRTSRAATIEGVLIAFNGSSANFTHRALYGTGPTAASGSGASGRAGVVNGNTSTANTFSNAYLYIPNYAGSTNKSYSVDSADENNTSAAFESFLELVAGLWSQTAAITSLRITPDLGNNLVIGSTVSLYGVTKGSDGIVTVS
jgi:hypothetical protein